MLLLPVDRIEAGETERLEREFVACGRPVVISRAALSWPVIDLVALDGLRERHGTYEIPVRESDNELDGRPSGSKRTRMALGEYIDLLLNPSMDGLRPYATFSLSDNSAAASSMTYLIEACRFPQRMPPALSSDYRLWIGGAGQRGMIHNDPYHNWNAQLSGRKRFFLFPPNQHGALHAKFLNQDVWLSPVDPQSPDLDRFPNARYAEGFDCELNSGDVLYLPRFWWHSVYATTISVNINRWDVTLEKDDRWWHQQESARPFISYAPLLEEIRALYRSAPVEVQIKRRVEFEEVESSLLSYI